MMKKMTSMLLALTLCLTLSVPAFAAEEEPELTAEPAVQTEAETVAQEEVAAPAETEVETETADESVARDICLHKTRITDYYDEVDYGNYNASTHVVKHMKHEICVICKEDLGASPDSFSTESHSMRVSVYGTAIGSNGETVPTYLHECSRACGYYKISLYR